MLVKEICVFLRALRKEMAVKHAVSAYIVFTDAELAEIAKMTDITENSLRTIKGIGDKKAAKYGKELIENYNNLLKNQPNEASGQFNTTDKLF